MTVESAREVQFVWYDITPRLLKVVRLEQPSPRMRRVVLSGADLEPDFPFVRLAPSDHVKIVFPDPKTGVLNLPVVGERGIRTTADGQRPLYRDYTVRAVDREAGELSIDFVLHDHGVAGTWASRAQIGDQVGVYGPRGSRIFPSDYPWYLIAGDETALPAIGRWIEELPEGARASVFIEVPDAAERQDFAARPGIEISYVVRSETPSPTPLEDALRAWQPPEEDYFVWIAGEARALKPIRRYFRDELGLPKERLDVDGYWKRGVVNHDHHAEESEHE